MTAISKNVYFDVLDDIVNKYNNIVCKTIKMKSIDVKDNTIFLQKHTYQIGLKKPLLSVKLKIQSHGHMLLMILIVKKLQEHFVKKNCKRRTKRNLG